MFSAGMFAAFASPMIVRKRGFMSGSPPPARAATVNSLMMRVKILPRLASSAPFLCLMDAHFECPDMPETLPLFGQDDPDIRVRAALRAAAQLRVVVVLAPIRQVGDEIDAEGAATSNHPSHGLKRVREIAFADERLQNAVRREHHREAAPPKRQIANVSADEGD